MSRRSAALLAVACALAAPPAAAAEDPVVTTIEQVEKLDPATTRVTVRMGKHALLAALVKRVPRLEALVFEHPGNKVHPRTIALLEAFKDLRALTLTGDMFLYDEEFASLGRLKKLRSLRMALP